MLTPLQIQERAEAITARLKYLVGNAEWSMGQAIYTLPSTGKRIDFAAQKNGWKLSRVLYRIGELKISDAVADVVAARPLLKDEFDAQAFARTLGIIGSEAQRIVLIELALDFPTSKVVRRTVEQSLAQLKVDASANSDAKHDFFSIKNVETLTAFVQTRLRDDLVNDWLYPLYLHLHTSAPGLTKDFAEGLTTLPHRGNYFQPIRYIYKAAEQFGDLTTLAILAWWMWKGEPESSVYEQRTWDKVGEEWRSKLVRRTPTHPSIPFNWNDPTKIEDVADSKNIKWGFTAKTRGHFLGRIFRRLNELGRSREGKAYTQLATDFLLEFNNETVKPPFTEIEGRYTFDAKTKRYSYIRNKVYHPAGADLVPVYWITYGSKLGYDINPQKTLVRSYKRFAEMRHRGEPFRELWNESPAQIIRLLGLAELSIVQDFALRVYRDNSGFAAAVTTDDLVRFLYRRHDGINGLALELVEARPELMTEAIAYTLLVHDRQPLRDWASRKSSVPCPIYPHRSVWA